MVGAGDDAERSDEEERRRWLAPATMQSAAMRRSGADALVDVRRRAMKPPSTTVGPGRGRPTVDVVQPDAGARWWMFDVGR
nr:hypothetical protein [Mycobacterium tuberculosis]